MKLKSMLMIGLFALSASLPALADSIPLPYTTLPAGAPGTIGYSTNLANGWTNSTITTNVVQYWTNSPNFGTMVISTNYITNSVLTFADIDTSQQFDLTLLSQIGVSGSTTVGAITNRQLTFARVSALGVPDNVNTWTWSSAAFGPTNNATATNFTSWVGSFPKVRLIQDLWMCTNGYTMTNVDLEALRKRTTPVLNSGR